MGVDEWDQVRVGIEYGNDPAGATRIPPATLAGISRSVKIANVRWADCEPVAWPSWWPFPRYSFGWLKKQLDAWRAAGFDYVTLVVKCAHPSYTAATYTPPPGFASGFLGIASAPPKNEDAWNALDRWAHALVRAVRGRVQVIECESEWQSPAWWLGGLDEYMRWLGVLDSAIYAEAPEIKLCLGGHSLDGMIDDDPDDDTFNARILALPEPQRSVMARALEMGRTALASGAFDLVDIHSLGAASGIAPNVRRVREILPKWWDGEITIGDAFPGEPVCPSPLQGFPGDGELMARLLRRESAAYGELERRQRVVTAAKIEAAQAAGCSSIHFGPTYDWWPSPYPWQGLTRADGTPRPVCDVVRAAQ